MSYERRIAKLEERLDTGECHACGNPYWPLAEARALFDEIYADQIGRGFTAEAARRIAIKAAPDIALRLGFITRVPDNPNRCRVCARDLRPPDTRTIQEVAKEVLAMLTAAAQGDTPEQREARARWLLAQSFPELAAALAANE